MIAIAASPRTSLPVAYPSPAGECTADPRYPSILRQAMPSYRVTFRYGAPRALYEVLDIEAADLREAMRTAADRVPEGVAASAELVEVRAQTDPEEREFTQG